ncbi:hypothetical protein GCM10017600_04530 [Streptosporangium carneum]|uniref:Uncharacterized protein n=1 Tax=Streptosporangium carneum TaxID=47481 RepID=A0A9W6MAW8_9ACTN|nr:hypothetical protein GCM10017600_04530 [Streptosporangium carneum]
MVHRAGRERDHRAIEGGQRGPVTVTHREPAAQFKACMNQDQADLQAGCQEFESPRLHQLPGHKKAQVGRYGRHLGFDLRSIWFRLRARFPYVTGVM